SPLIQPVSAAGSLSERLAVSAEVSCLELAQHKRLLLCGLKSGTVLIYPLTFPQETLCIPPPESRSLVLCLAVSSQEKHLAVAYEDSVCLFEITTRDNFPTVEGPLGKATLSLLHAPLSCMALLPDHRLLYGTSCGEVKLHDFSGSESSNLQPHSSRVTCVTASNWGMHALVGSHDGMQRLWALNPVALDHTMEYKVRSESFKPQQRYGFIWRLTFYILHVLLLIRVYFPRGSSVPPSLTVTSLSLLDLRTGPSKSGM
ncbi:hypothetical protein GOODEAATRI_033405, partial [Goodea atripinnis]